MCGYKQVHYIAKSTWCSTCQPLPYDTSIQIHNSTRVISATSAGIMDVILVLLTVVHLQPVSVSFIVKNLVSSYIVRLTSHLTHYRSFLRRFYRSDDPTNSVIALKDNG